MASNYNISEPTKAQRYVGDVFKATVQVNMPDYCQDNFRLESQIDHLTNELAARLSIYVAALDGKTETTKEFIRDSKPPEIIEHYFEVPFTWWDHFKMRYFPKWKRNMQKRYYTGKIVHNTTIVKTIKTTHLCPHSKVDPQWKHFEFLIYGPSKGDKQ